jgi:hypothetical protein
MEGRSASPPAIIVGEPDVPDILRPATGRIHDLHSLAPDAVFTVRTYGDITPPYGPGLVRRFTDHKPRNRRSAPYARRD